MGAAAERRQKYISEREQLADSMSHSVSAKGKDVLNDILATEEGTIQALLAAGKMGMENRQQEATAYLMKTVRPVQRKCSVP